MMQSVDRGCHMLPRVIIHNAVSADGRIDWFEADVGVLYDLAGRWHEDCALVGSGTVLAAPESAARDKGPWEPQVALPTDTRPLLAIVDSRGASAAGRRGCRCPTGEGVWRSAQTARRTNICSTWPRWGSISSLPDPRRST